MWETLRSKDVSDLKLNLCVRKELYQIKPLQWKTVAFSCKMLPLGSPSYSLLP